MSVDVKIDIDIKEIEDSFSSESILRAEKMVANQMLLDLETFVPRGKTGKLRSSGHVKSNSVFYNTVYARAQFYGTNGIVTFRKYTTGGTGKRWDKVGIGRNLEKWSNVALKGLKV